jgi:hypothetical protein
MSGIKFLSQTNYGIVPELRGKNVAVKVEGKTVTVQCLHLEANVDYAIFIEHSRLANPAVAKKTADSFTITVADTAPKTPTSTGCCSGGLS